MRVPKDSLRAKAVAPVLDLIPPGPLDKVTPILLTNLSPFQFVGKGVKHAKNFDR